MPRGDKTGPRGKGPKTGRGLGSCEGSKEPGYKQDAGRPYDGRGQGRGWRRKK